MTQVQHPMGPELTGAVPASGPRPLRGIEDGCIAQQVAP